MWPFSLRSFGGAYSGAMAPHVWTGIVIVAITTVGDDSGGSD